MSIARSISRAKATSAGRVDKPAGDAVGFATAGGGGADFLDSLRALVWPINNGTRKHTAIAVNEKINVLLRLDISDRLAGKQRLCSSGAKQLTGCGIHFVDVNGHYALTKN